MYGRVWQVVSYVVWTALLGAALAGADLAFGQFIGGSFARAAMVAASGVLLAAAVGWIVTRRARRGTLKVVYLAPYCRGPEPVEPDRLTPRLRRVALGRAAWGRPQAWDLN